MNRIRYGLYLIGSTRGLINSIARVRPFVRKLLQPPDRSFISAHGLMISLVNTVVVRGLLPLKILTIKILVLEIMEDTNERLPVWVHHRS